MKKEREERDREMRNKRKKNKEEEGGKKLAVLTRPKGFE